MEKIKERYEWIRSWTEESTKDDLPRVLLVGDSITEGYYPLVRKKLDGICYVNYASCSYSVERDFFKSVFESLIKDTDYAVVHFAKGLHEFHLTASRYRENILESLKKVEKNTKLILATGTKVNTEGNAEARYDSKLKMLNNVISEIANEQGYPVDDLFTVSENIPSEKRAVDGWHYTEEGSDILADVVAKCIKDNL